MPKDLRRDLEDLEKPIDYDLIHYLNFDKIRLMITQNENWCRIFYRCFGRPEGIISRLGELDSIRDAIAHGRHISDFDFNALKTLYEQLLACMEEKAG